MADFSRELDLLSDAIVDISKAVELMPTKYTNEMLTHNFNYLKGYIANSERDFDVIYQRLMGLESRMDKVLQQGAQASKIVVKAHKRSKLLVLGVVAGSVYVGYQLALFHAETSLSDLKNKKPANATPIKPDTEKD